MRSEQVMTDIILTFSKQDDRVRAAVLNGSRVNPDVPRDRFRDYDIVFVVSSVDEFVQDRSWIARFGEILVMQTPDEKEIPEPGNRDCFAFLMLFTDGNRIDLTLHPTDRMSSLHLSSLSLVLLDKDGIMEPLAAPSNRDYLPVRPTAKQFADCCNEFWWVSTYIAKGLWRRELPYAKYMFERPVRDMLMLMLSWQIGIRKDFAADPGKFGKYFEKNVEPEQWKAFVLTYADADYENIWQALFVMCDLFRETAMRVAAHLGYSYPFDDDTKVTAYLKSVRDLPNDTSHG